MSRMSMGREGELPAAPDVAPERRDFVERRSRPTPRFSRYSLLGGRRRGPRRVEEVEGTFVDVYGIRWWALILWIAAMNCLDTYFTLFHLQAGGAEINPVADELLRTGRLGFVLTKTLLIGVALVVLTVHKNFTMARLGTYVAAGVYGLLVVYHLTLLGR
ncbi:MAG: DUF5658 family protein [Planctomycetota bacterium]